MATPARKLEQEVAETAQVTKERQAGGAGKGGLVIREYPLVALAVLAVGATVFVAIRRRRARASVIVAD